MTSSSKSRRPRGTGHIKQLAPGKAQVTVRSGRNPVTGKYIRKYETITGTKDEIQQQANRLSARYGTGQRGASSANHLTVLDIILEFLDHNANDRARSTKERDAWILNILPDTLASTRADKVTVRQLEETWNELARQGCSAERVFRLRAMLVSAYKLQMRWERIDRNPASLSTNIKKKKNNRKRLPTEQGIERLYDYLCEDPTFMLYVRLGIVTAMRNGELCGIQWGDFYDDFRKLDVMRSVDKWGNVNEGGKENTEDTVPIDPWTAELLEEMHADATATARSRGHNHLDPKTWVFQMSRRPGRPWRPDVAYKQFRFACEAVGMPKVTPHSMRHLVATKMIGEGVPLSVVAKVLRHADETVTARVYVHVIGKAEEKAVEMLGEMMPVPKFTRRTKEVPPIDDDKRLREAILKSLTRADILTDLGLSLATKNYARLERRATEIGAALPDRVTHKKRSGAA